VRPSRFSGLLRPGPLRTAALASGVAAALGAAGICLCAAGFVRITPEGQVPDESPVTFTRDVAPIVFRRCASCHRPGEAAPFPLLTFDDVRQRAEQIALVTRTRFMPPWLPEEGYGEFAGSRRLTDAELATIQRWVDEGAPEGEAEDLPEPPSWPEGWQLGEPDLIVRMPEPYTVPAEGADVFRRFVMPLAVEAERFVNGFEFRPGNAGVVHHVILRIDRTGRSQELRDLDPEPGSGGMLFEGEFAESPDGHFLGWTPGNVPELLPEGMAWRLEPGSNLVMELHLQPTGKPEVIQSTVGFFFTDRAPERVPLGLQLGSYLIDIPPGESAYRIEDSYELPVDVSLHSIYPHAHYLGDDLKGYATLPDGTRRWLFWIPDWDFNWQDQYRYEEPMELPAGTVLSMEYVYDNSADNVQNPHQPPERVRYGGNSGDEMGNLWMQVLPKRPEDRLVLERDYARKRVTRYAEGYERMLAETPDSLPVLEQLAIAELQLGQTDRALATLESALALAPEMGRLHFHVGNVLTARGDLPAAISAFRRALDLAPDLPDAHVALGAALRASGRPADAIDQYRQALVLDPTNAPAHEHLANALAAGGDLVRAAAHYREAIRADTEGAAAHGNLAWILLTTGVPTAERVAEALALASRAVELSGGRDPVLLETEAVAFAAAGDTTSAVSSAERALALAEAAGADDLASGIRTRLEAWRQP